MTEIETAADTLRECLRNLATTDLGTVFAASFFAHTPEPLLRSRLAHLVKELGPAERVEVAETLTPHSARIRARFALGYVADGDLAVSEADASRIQWLHFGMPTRCDDSWEAIERDVRRLSGEVSFEVRELAASAPLVSVHAELALGVGSVSKLVIFCALLDAVASGAFSFEQVVRLADEDRSLPTGVLQDWPADSPLTLHSAAVLLLSISDNTAADLLLRVLGRERVEAVLARLSPHGGAGLKPFLSTRELFALVAGPQPRREAFLGGDEARRRAAIAEARCDGLPDLAAVTGVWPAGLDWCYSARQLGTLLGGLRAHLSASETARAIFATNRALNLGAWRFAAFKGGSSAGRAAFAAVVEDEDERWWGACFVHNGSPAEVSVEADAHLVKRAVDRLRG